MSSQLFSTVSLQRTAAGGLLLRYLNCPNDYGSAIEAGLRALDAAGPAGCGCATGRVRRLCVACCRALLKRNADEMAEIERRRRAFWNPYYMAKRVRDQLYIELYSIPLTKASATLAAYEALHEFCDDFEHKNWHLFSCPPWP